MHFHAGNALPSITSYNSCSLKPIRPPGRGLFGMCTSIGLLKSSNLERTNSLKSTTLQPYMEDNYSAWTCLPEPLTPNINTL
jgi:hypothetical protein